MAEVESGGLAKRRGRPPSGRGVAPIAVTIRGSGEWKAWLEEYGHAKGMTSADLIELALTQMAKRDKNPAPPRRVV